MRLPVRTQVTYAPTGAGGSGSSSPNFRRFSSAVTVGIILSFGLSATEYKHSAFARSKNLEVMLK